MFEKNAILIINLFLVPMISLAILQKKRLISNNYFDIFKSYCILCVANLIVTKIPLALARIILNTSIELFSVKYTLLSTFCSVILPYIYLIAKKYIKVKCEIKEKNEASE
ncbi:MAG: hypothetical protein K5866_00505 [Treponema sp.]|nr:hypothetical protein [Treponema sp.]